MTKRRGKTRELKPTTNWMNSHRNLDQELIRVMQEALNRPADAEGKRYGQLPKGISDRQIRNANAALIRGFNSKLELIGSTNPGTKRRFCIVPLAGPSPA